MGKTVVTIERFASIIKDLLFSDRDVNIGCGGMTGVGKSTFISQLLKEYCKQSNQRWTFDMMTWERQEMLKWIDGEKGSEKDPITGLRKGQKPEYTPIMADELFHMFYRRNWMDGDQIEAISIFNMCRDRHLFIAGAVPNFWNLDTAFTERIRYYVYIPKRGLAWVFEQENNPFSKDQWNHQENLRMFRKSRDPYDCPNFLFEINFEDWDDKEKTDYLAIRNKKRIVAIESKEPKGEHRWKKQRDALIADVHHKKVYNQTEIAKIVGVTPQSINEVVQRIKLKEGS